jgi:hypothetical protein
MHVDDAVEFIVDFVRNPRDRGAFSTFGYELKLEIVTLTYLKEIGDWPPHIQYVQDHPRARELSPMFFEAAWELCRRGILRPSVQFIGGQGSADGTGYSLTTFGRRWITDDSQQVLLLGPERISELFGKLSERLGSAFLQRATEAGHCHAFGLHVACCAMCGAAAESILLAVAVAKSGDEAATLASYRTANGRRRVIDSIVGQARQSIADPFRSATGLLSYWRDDAAHGVASTISEIEAHEALARLLRFAQFATDNWGELTGH